MAAPSWLDQVGAIAERGRAILHLRRLDNLERACRRLIAQRGEATSIALAAAVVDAIERMDEDETQSFLRLLLDHFSADPTKVEAAVERWRRDGDRRSLDVLWET